MPDEELTEIVLVVGQGALMQLLWKDAADGVNDLINHQKTLPGKLQLTFVLFDTGMDFLYDGVAQEQIRHLPDKPTLPGGNNSLLDAIGNTISAVRRRLDRTPEEQKPASVIFCIVTEDHDRASIDYTYKQIGKMVERQEQEQKWVFFLAAPVEDPGGMANAISIGPDNAYHFEPTDTGVRRILRDFDALISAVRVGQKNSTKSSPPFEAGSRRDPEESLAV